MTLRRLAAAAVTTAVLLTPTVGATVAHASAPAGATAAAAPAAADVTAARKGCVTRAEYKKVRKGMLQSQVHRIFGAAGKQVSRTDAGPGGIITARRYAVCTSKRGAVGVSFVAKRGQGPKLASKAASWR